MADPITVALVNDYEVIVRGLERMLSPYADCIRVVELDVGTAASRPVDLSLYDTFALAQIDTDHIDEVLGHPHSGRVVVYSWNTQPELVRLALDKGARGYLSKSLPADELVEALHRIDAGEVVVSSHEEVVRERGSVRTCLTGPESWPGQAYGLSGRESEVLALIARGQTNDEIARRMYLSINTVKTYVRSAYRKIDVDSRPRAVIWGMSHGLSPSPGGAIPATRLHR